MSYIPSKALAYKYGLYIQIDENITIYIHQSCILKFIISHNYLEKNGI